MKLTIGYFYPELLNLYGDRGNIFCLAKRCQWRGIEARVEEVGVLTPTSQLTDQMVDLLFMGGGPDRSQVRVARDLKKKGPWLRNYIEQGGVGLFICGAYQLMGHYYQDADGRRLEGLGIFDLATRHFGKDKPRCIGNIVVGLSISSSLTPAALVGFENHGGRTYLGKKAQPLGRVVKGFGNNGEDKTEGAVYKSAFGTYLHGPLLPKNPHFADYLISLALKGRYGEEVKLEPLNDTLEWQAHKAALKLK